MHANTSVQYQNAFHRMNCKCLSSKFDYDKICNGEKDTVLVNCECDEHAVTESVCASVAEPREGWTPRSGPGVGHVTGQLTKLTQKYRS